MGAIVPAIECNSRVNQYMEKLLKRPDASSLLSYGTPEGTKRHREAGAAWLKKSGFCTDSDHIILAAGGQNALTASLGAFFERGGTELVQIP